jgi:hypothetical protein
MEANFPNLQWLSIGIDPRHSNRRTQGATQENEPSTVVRRHFARSDQEEQLIEEFRELYAFDREAGSGACGTVVRKTAAIAEAGIVCNISSRSCAKYSATHDCVDLIHGHWLRARPFLRDGRQVYQTYRLLIFMIFFMKLRVHIPCPVLYRQPVRLASLRRGSPAGFDRTHPVPKTSAVHR